MNKTVRHVIGSAGVAPVLGLMLPAAAMATAAPGAAPGAVQAPAAKAKTVSLTHTVAAPAAPARAGCAGSNRHHKTKGNEQLTFWSAPLGNPVSFDCVGTIAGRWSGWPNERGWQMRTRIYGNGTLAYHALTGCGKVNFDTVTCNLGVHKYIRDPIQVCLAWRKVYSDSAGGIFVSVTPPICIKVNR
jgi:hypothetical protein